VSGPAAIETVAPLVVGALPLADVPPHRLRRVSVVDPSSGRPLDEALCAVMRAPRSYTGEDVVELSCHGSPALLRVVVARMLRGGARLAAPGEFTRRAFLNGRLGLAQAEAVALLIGARTERAVALAARALAGGLAEPVRAVHDALLDLIAGLEVTLDFPEEGVGTDVADAAAGVGRLCDEARRLLLAAREGRVIQEGLVVAIVGAPNAGKSSLLNALVGRERAIVSPLPGTTRDVVEATIVIAGVPVRLLDTAGLGPPGDPVEAEGMRRTRQAMEEAHLLVFVVDGSVPPPATVLEPSARRPVVTVRAKSDRPLHPAAGAIAADGVAVSAVTGAGLDVLVDRLTVEVGHAAGQIGDEGTVVASLRQLELLDGLAEALGSAENALAEAPLEVALVDLRRAIGLTSALLGIDIGDAVLDRIFSTFCLGK
jgi:tRNA modification GTPase